MILYGKYKFEMEFQSLILDLQCLKALTNIFAEHAMSYNINLDFKTGDSIADLTIDDLIKDISLEKKRIKEITVRATNDITEIDLHLDYVFDGKIKTESNNYDEFKQLKQEIQEWSNLYKSHNPFVFLAPFSTKSEVVRILICIGLSILTLFPMIISTYINGGSVKVLDSITVFLFFTFCYYFLLLFLCWIFIKKVEIDIGLNQNRTRRKVGNWVVSVILIPVLISWIFSWF